MRTIILQEVPTPSGESTYWALNENGRIIEGLGQDELLWAAACLIMNREWPYNGGSTLEQSTTAAFKKGVLAERSKSVPAHMDPDSDLPF